MKSLSDFGRGRTLLNNSRQFTAIIEREDDSYVALCPEIDIASQGKTVEEARLNLKEAIELFFETASPQEISTSVKKNK